MERVKYPRTSFSIETLGENVHKFVRPNHVQTDQHWSQGPIIPNRVATPEKA